MEAICRVIQPEKTNLNSYGHDIRNVLLLACTEAEAHWKWILEKNGVERHDRQNTNDYVRLLKPMRLAEFSVAFSFYPWMTKFSPFEKWNSDKASKSLFWYVAYNNAKHDIGTYFHLATLQNAFDALSACFVMMCAQYGWDFALEDKDADRSFMKLVDYPKWHPSQVYVSA